MKLAFLFLIIAQVFAEEPLAPGDTGGSEAVFAKNELPPFDWQPLPEPAADKAEALVEVKAEPSPGDVEKHDAEYYEEFKVDEEQDTEEEEEEEGELVEVEGKLAEDDTEKHEEIFDDDEETVDDYEGLVEEDGELPSDDKGDHEFKEPKDQDEPINLNELEEEIEDGEPGGCGGKTQNPPAHCGD